MRILLVEDDTLLGEGIKDGLVVIGSGLTVKRLDAASVWWYVNDIEPVADDLLPGSRP